MSDAINSSVSPESWSLNQCTDCAIPGSRTKSALPASPLCNTLALLATTGLPFA